MLSTFLLNHLGIYYTDEVLDLLVAAATLGSLVKMKNLGFPGGAVVENLPANAGDTGSSPGLGGSHMPRSN